MAPPRFGKTVSFHSGDRIKKDSLAKVVRSQFEDIFRRLFRAHLSLLSPGFSALYLLLADQSAGLLVGAMVCAAPCVPVLVGRARRGGRLPAAQEKSGLFYCTWHSCRRWAF